MLIRQLILCGFFILAIASNSIYASTILIYGDSLSAGFGLAENEDWPSLLNQHLEKSDYRVVNESISGETTAGGLARLPAALNKHKPSVVILELGANDGLRGLSLKAMKNNLTHMIEISQLTGSKVLLAGIYIPPNYGKRYTNTFNKVFTDLHKEFNVAFIPFLLENIADNDELMQADGLHPRAKAQHIIKETVYKKLKPLLHSKT